ncbi:MAG: NAD(P)-dependent glycerol-3-phosphate dehydrogenase [Gammaproteobacteria bacterium]|nr:NAD(P)-dependent glycerol-3-phosphate dehydrogenase [Gammaproteobacteria bacterium]
MQLDRSGTPTLLWGRSPEKIREMKQTLVNSRYLPGCTLSDSIRLSADLESVVSQADHVLMVVPSEAFADTLRALQPHLTANTGVAWACKGFEPDSGRLLHHVAGEILGDDVPLAVVTGPSFAAEVAKDLPTAVTVAGRDDEFTRTIASALHGGRFRAYTSDDIIGAELGGAVKNVLAIATGIGDGMGLGDNARAALITRGLAELMRLGQVLGARPETLMGLAGVGDLVLTCTGDLSRNRRLGLALGKGKDATRTVAEIGQVVEGINTAVELHRLAEQHDVSMPISKQVYGLLKLGWDAEECVRRLLAREQKAETS